MMRRTFQRYAMLWSKSKPIYEVLMAAQPLGGKVWGQELTLLRKYDIHTAGCWAKASAETKVHLVREGLSRDVMAALDAKVGEGLHLGISKKLLVLYGSQTGTSEAYAKMIGMIAATHGYTPVVASMNESIELIKRSHSRPEAVIFVCSTYGTGEFPSNAEHFYQSLKAGQVNELREVPYSILGLGNSKQEHFCEAAKKLDHALKKIGAHSVMRMQLSCELAESGHESVFRSWKKNLWAALGHDVSSGSIGSCYQATPIANVNPDRHVENGYFQAAIHINREVSSASATTKHYLMEFQVETEDQKEMFGGLKGRQFGRLATITDQVDVLPKNSDSVVAKAGRRLNLDPNQIVEITPLTGAPESVINGKKYRIYTILSEIIDFSAVPTRSFLEALSNIATDPTEQARLVDLANDLQPGSAYDKLAGGAFSVLDALEMFPSAKISLSQLLSFAPHIKPRTYSLARDNAATKLPINHFEILYTVPSRAAENRQHVGLCTSMMASKQAGSHITLRFHPGTTKLPPASAPVCLVALGTGIGFIRSILQHRAAEQAAGVAVAPAALFYGYRTENDKLFSEELAEFQRLGLLTRVEQVPSGVDPSKLVTPMEKFDANLKSFLGETGHVVFCGVGGSVPLLVEQSFRRVGVDVTTLRATGRYHEDFFTPDLDTENLLKSHAGAHVEANTLAGRMGKCDMFCMQCEQTFKGKGCHKVGVCGKTPRVAAMQDLLIQGCRHLGFYAYELRQAGVTIDPEINRFLLSGMFSTLTNVNFDEARFVKFLGQLRVYLTSLETAAAQKGITAKPSGLSLPSPLPSADGLVELGRMCGVLTRFTEPSNQSSAAVTEMLMYGLKGICAYADHSLMNRLEDAAIYNFLQEALHFLAGPNSYDLNKALGLCIEAGKINVAAMSLLYKSNSTLGVPKPTVVSNKPVPGKAILVSGHDLIILKALLEKTAPLGINVYTHGEMLPAHSYPELKKYKNLVANYGGAWMRQGVEFPFFPGPILMTTNCLTEPHESYRERTFTANAVGWPNIQHLGDTIADINFDPLIRSAQSTPGFGNEAEFGYADPSNTLRPASYTIGFGHETILSVAPTVIEQIKKGNITRFFVVGGCDGFEGERSYYTELVKKLPPTAVVLTVGCGKYRLNHLNLGTIGDTGIPRILDMGQCNDSFSAVQVALALADVLKCKVSDLPLSIVLSWFEQKAVAVLLSLLALGIKPIRIGPTPPAFVTPEVLGVLVNNYGVKLTGDPAKDVADMCAATGAS